MPLDDRLQFFRDLYEFEIHRREALEGTLSLPVGIVVLLLGATYRLATAYVAGIPKTPSWLDLPFAVSALFCVTFASVALKCPHSMCQVL